MFLLFAIIITGSNSLIIIIPLFFFVATFLIVRVCSSVLKNHLERVSKRSSKLIHLSSMVQICLALVFTLIPCSSTANSL